MNTTPIGSFGTNSELEIGSYKICDSSQSVTLLIQITSTTQIKKLKKDAEMGFEPGPIGAKDNEANTITITPQASMLDVVVK